MGSTSLFLASFLILFLLGSVQVQQGAAKSSPCWQAHNLPEKLTHTAVRLSEVRQAPGLGGRLREGPARACAQAFRRSEESRMYCLSMGVCVCVVVFLGDPQKRFQRRLSL